MDNYFSAEEVFGRSYDKDNNALHLNVVGNGLPGTFPDNVTGNDALSSAFNKNTHSINVVLDGNAMGSSGSSGVDGNFYGSSGTSGEGGTSGTSGNSPLGVTRPFVGVSQDFQTSSGEINGWTFGTPHVYDVNIEDVNRIDLNYIDSYGMSLYGWLNSWSIGTQIIKLEQKDNALIFGFYRIDNGFDNPTFSQFSYNVTYLTGSVGGKFTDFTNCLVSSFVNGSGTSGTSGSSGVDGNFYGSSGSSGSSGVSGIEFYINPNSTTQTVGGITAGSSFPTPGKTITEMWDTLLYPYQSPTFTSLYFTSDNLVHEVGQPFGSLNNTINWTTSNSSNVSGNSISVSGWNLTTLNGLSNDGSESVTFTSLPVQNVVGTRSWSINGINTNGVTMTTRTYTLSWIKMMYWGNSNNSHLTSIVLSNSTASLKSTYTGTYPFVGGDYKYFFFDNDMGMGTPIFKDSSTGFSIDMEPEYSITTNNGYGISCTYRVFRSTYTLGGNITIIVT